MKPAAVLAGLSAIWRALPALYPKRFTAPATLPAVARSYLTKDLRVLLKRFRDRHPVSSVMSCQLLPRA